MKNTENSKNCIHIFLSQTKDLIFFVLSSFGMSLSIIAILIDIKMFVEQLIKENYKISPYTLFFLLFCAIGIGFYFLKEISRSSIKSNIRNKLLKEAYIGMINGEITAITDYNTKESVNCLVEDCEKISDYYFGDNILQIISKVIYAFSFLVFAIIIQPILGLILFLLVPFYVIADKAVSIASSALRKPVDDSIEVNTKKVKTDYKLISDIKLKNGTELEKEVFIGDLQDYKKNKTNFDVINIVNTKVLQCIFMVLYLAITIGLGGVLYTSARYNVGIGVFFVLGFISPTIFVLTKSIMSYKFNKSIIEENATRIYSLIDLHTEIRSEPVTSFEDINGLRLNEVSYFIDKTPILNDISFEVKKSDSLGIYINDKKTKDVLFSLLTKFERPDKGEIQMNSCNYAKIQISLLRSVISTITDNNQLFDISIQDNIIYPKEFNEYLYNDALNKSGLKNIVSQLPNKDQTKMSDEALIHLPNYQEIVNRIIFANCFYKDSKVYLFCDATADFDFSTELELFNEVAKMKNKIVLVITDKPYLLKCFHNVLIIQDGKIVESGTYDELASNKESILSTLNKKYPVEIKGIKKTKMSQSGQKRRIEL